MNLITFNIDDKLLNKRSYSIVSKKKNLLFHFGCQHNKSFEKINKYRVAKVYELNKKGNLPNKLKYLEKSYNELLKNLYKKLNKAHNKNYDQNYWEILIGKWLKTFVHQTYSNWEILKKIENKYNIKSFSKISLSDNFFIPENTWHAHLLTRSSQHKYNLFHHWLISKMLENKKKIKINHLSLKNNLSIESELLKLSKPNKYQNIFYKSLDNKIFYYLWDVPRKIKIEIMKYFKFLNIHLNTKTIREYHPKYFDRDLIFYNEYQPNNFQSFLKNIIKFTFPKIFLENFNTLERMYKKLNWPRKPKYILTSYPYYEELFKLYCAQNYFSGSKIIITQHGMCNIFQYDDALGPASINKTFFHAQLSWGKNRKKGLKKFLFTKKYTTKVNKFKFKKNKKILLILYSFSEMEDRLPNGYSDNNSINKIIYNSTIKYLKQVEKSLLKKNDIKILQNNRYPMLKNSIKKKYRNIKFMGLEKSFDKVIFQYNLSVHFFIGTPFFESIYLNQPTILIFDSKIYSSFDKKFLRFIKKFIDNKICFTNAAEAAEFINNNYTNLEHWWKSPKRQKILNEFCEMFCGKSKNLHEDFKSITKI